MEFKDWFYNEYVKWRGDTRKTYSDFAEWLGLPQPRVSRYMNGDDKFPSFQTVQLIGKRLPSIHSYFFAASQKVAPELADKIRQIMIEALSECERQNITPTSPEGRVLMDSILSKHGIHTSSKT